jgi:integrase
MKDNSNIRFTRPQIYMGKAPDNLKGKKLQENLLKNSWCISYSFDGKQVRVKQGINRYKTYDERLVHAQALLVHITNKLNNGYNPHDEKAWATKVLVANLTLTDAIAQFKDYHENKIHSKKKTIQTYLSKLTALDKYLSGAMVRDIETKDLEAFVYSKIQNGDFSNQSVKSAKRIFSAFFNFCMQQKYIEVSPYSGFDKKIKSVKQTPPKHRPFTSEELKKVMDYLDEHDAYCAFVCRFIYYTCLRPKEIRDIKLEYIDMDKRILTLPAHAKKVTHNYASDIIHLDNTTIDLLESVNLRNFPSDYYLIGCTTHIIGKNRIGENTPYNRFRTALEKLNMHEQNFDFYGIKHTSNIHRYEQNWALPEIMKINRHKSLLMTMEYFKGLGVNIDMHQRSVIPI